jgi:hypothetical protein
MSTTPPREPDRPAGTERTVTRRSTAEPAVGATTTADLRRWKTSAAAVFALVFGLSALFCALTAFLAPLGVAFGLIALILGIVGIVMSNRPGVTGKGVAIGGLVTGLLGLLLGAAILVGAAVYFNDPENIDRIERQLEQLREDLPTEVPSPD